MIAATEATTAVWNGISVFERARTLAATRYVDFADGPNDKHWRRRSATAIQQGSKLDKDKLSAWRSFALQVAGQNPESDQFLFARLQSRLMVNMAGGVIENGGICLDYVSGVPYIPGSAVKGCARAMAIHNLLELVTRAGTEDVQGCAAELLTICLVFGWGDEEWKEGRKPARRGESPERAEHYSDFAYACGSHWTDIRHATATALCERLEIQPKKSECPWIDLPHFSGTIAFLPAFPWERDPSIDLDIITSHHPDYYESDDPNAVALDTEEPRPVVFPAVSAAKLPVFAFLLQPTARADSMHLTVARNWLAEGLETLGIGAKTNAGYGWFLRDSEFAGAYVTRLAQERDERQRLEEEAKNKATAEQKRQEERAREAKLSNLSPDEKEDALVADLTDAQFEAKMRAFCKESKKGGPSSDAAKQAFVRALRGPRLAFWLSFKTRATKGELATVALAIQALSKAMNLGKMP